MRTARLKESSPATYHLISRIVDRQMLFNANEKERIRKTLRAVEAFSGVQVLTYCLLDNHFHLLLHVPEPSPVSDSLFLERLSHLYDNSMVQRLAAKLERRRADGLNDDAEALKARYTYRMNDLSEFAKTFKQRITQSYNTRHDRKGTLWEERFKSVLLEGQSGAVAAVAAYIDLNALRAGLVQDPKDYRFCGYGEAVAGDKHAQAGLAKVTATPVGTAKQGAYPCAGST